MLPVWPYRLLSLRSSMLAFALSVPLTEVLFKTSLPLRCQAAREPRPDLGSILATSAPLPQCAPCDTVTGAHFLIAPIPVQLRVPSNLTLLPGHLYMMSEALAKEEARRVLEMPS